MQKIFSNFEPLQIKKIRLPYLLLKTKLGKNEGNAATSIM